MMEDFLYLEDIVRLYNSAERVCRIFLFLLA